MKKLFLGLFTVLTITSFAQIERGDLFVGGSLGFNTSGGSDIFVIGGTTTEVINVSTLGYDITPNIGYMLTDNIGAGLGIGYGYTKTTIPDFFNNGTDLFDQVIKTGRFNISPFARYFMGVSEKFYLFGELAFPIGFGNDTELMWNTDNSGVVDTDEKNSLKNFGFGIGLGADYFVSNKVALEARINVFGLSFNKYETTFEQANGNKFTTKDSYFNLDFNTDNLIDVSSLTIGVKIFL